METFQLLEKYLLENINKSQYDEPRLSDFDLDGSIIKIKFGYVFTFYSGDKTIEYRYIEVDLLDYITWVFNQCKHKE